MHDDLAFDIPRTASVIAKSADRVWIRNGEEITVVTRETGAMLARRRLHEPHDAQRHLDHLVWRRDRKAFLLRDDLEGEVTTVPDIHQIVGSSRERLWLRGANLVAIELPSRREVHRTTSGIESRIEGSIVVTRDDEGYSAIDEATGAPLWTLRPFGDTPLNSQYFRLEGETLKLCADVRLRKEGKGTLIVRVDARTGEVVERGSVRDEPDPDEVRLEPSALLASFRARAGMAPIPAPIETFFRLVDHEPDLRASFEDLGVVFDDHEIPESYGTEDATRDLVAIWGSGYSDDAVALRTSDGVVVRVSIKPFELTVSDCGLAHYVRQLFSICSSLGEASSAALASELLREGGFEH